MSDLGNAVDATFVGPSGLQLWDGTILNHGDIVLSVGKDEAEHSPYWEIVGPAGATTGIADASSNRLDGAMPAYHEPAPAPEQDPTPAPVVDPDPVITLPSTIFDTEAT